MNRPHVAALLRMIADRLDLCEGIVSPEAKEAVAFLRSDIIPRLRLRAGEIEAGG
jgi:hypothetical protein